ncbi:MAG TPA: HDOD domain-containing protein [Bryobacteraceae bacterium]|nr:HDOD domain-containing protein [Bryobacteraceae bacterium]
MPQATAELNPERLTREVLLSKIPAFPPVVLRALDLLSNDRTEIAELARLITSDATLSAQVLRMANSALFGFSSQIDTVQHGVVALGLSRVQSLIMTVATTNYMRAAFRTEALTKCWRHTLASAVVSRELARASGQDPDRAYTLGLLHDIGRLGLLVGYPNAYKEILAEADRDAVSLLDLEKRRFGMDHCEAGRLLMAEWGLPQAVLVATGRHHDPPQGGPFDMLQIVYLACRLADMLGYFVVAPLLAAPFEELTAMLPAEARSRFPQDADALRQIVERAIGDGELSPQPGARPPFETLPLSVEDPAAGPATTGAPTPWTDWEEQTGWDVWVIAITLALFVALLLAVKFLGYNPTGDQWQIVAGRGGGWPGRGKSRAVS